MIEQNKQTIRYPEIEVKGLPFELGSQIGEAAKEQIKGFAAIALERVNKTMAVSYEKAINLAKRAIPYVEQYSPDMLEELQGVAYSSGVLFEQLMFLNIRNQLKPEEQSGCTSFALASEAAESGQSIVGQNWDNDPELDPFTVILTRRPVDKPAFMNITQAGLISYIGFNEAGIGIGLTTLPAPSRSEGVPHYFIVRGIYESKNIDEAVCAVARAKRAISANLIMATPQGVADLEITIDNVYLLRGDKRGTLIHTNHCLHPDSRFINDQFPELIESVPRQKRMELLFDEMDKPISLNILKQLLQDHQGYPKSICRHPNDHPITGFWTSVFSVIMEVEQGKMHVSRGNPCTKPYEIYTLK